MRESAKLVTLEDLWSLDRVAEPAISPDGKAVVASVMRYDMDENRGSANLWIFSARGGKARRLTSGNQDFEPRWSPDGKWIAFTAQRADDLVPQVYVVAPDGRGEHRLTRVATGVAGLRWFANGARIAFIAWVWPGPVGDKAQKKRLRSRPNVHITERGGYRYADHWLTDGRVPQLFSVDLATHRVRNLLRGTGLSLPLFGPSAELYDIRPDGKEVALTVDLQVDPMAGNEYDIALVALDSSQHAWTNMTGGSKLCNSEPRYSPDGRWLAYLASNLRRSPDDPATIKVLSQNNGRTRQLARGWDRTPSGIAWLPDSSGLLLVAEESARRCLWRLHLSEKWPSKIGEGGSVRSFAVSRNGARLVINRSTASQPPCLVVSDLDGRRARHIGSVNDRWARKLLGATREATVPGWDGNPVHLWITYPPNFSRRKKWPLLQLIHGGPHNAWLDEFHFLWNPHMFAANGYIVVCVNYHGSSGWGKKFMESINGRYGRKELTDIEAATDFMLDQGYVDRTQLFAAGASHGGYLVARLNGSTRRYRAYVCHAGCYDWLSMLSTDVYMQLRHELGRFYWENEALVRKQSAHHRARHFRTPTLISHGEMDYRVPVTQAFEYYNTLKARGVEARLVCFADEGHWIQKPQNARLWAREFFSWLARHP